MGLSAEMVSYVKTGHCPCCHEEILSPAHVSQHGDDLRSAALSLLGDLGDTDKEADRPGSGSGLLEKFIHSALNTLETAVVLHYKAILVPDTAKAQWFGARQIQCQTCMNPWGHRNPSGHRSPSRLTGLRAAITSLRRAGRTPSYRPRGHAFGGAGDSHSDGP